MDKKKLKLSISGNTKKTINNIEQARSNPKNSVIINNNRNFQKKKFHKTSNSSDKFNKNTSSFGTKRLSQSFFPKKDLSDFEKRKLAEQRATKRLKGNSENKDKKTLKQVRRKEN